MKNKTLMAVLAVLLLVVCGALLLPKGEKKSTSTGADQTEAQKTVKVGVLQLVTHEALDEIYHGFVDGLAEAGYKEGDGLSLQFLNAEGDQSNIKTMSQQLVKSNDLVMGIATPAAQGLATATSDLPVVMGAISDPLGAKLVDSLTKPSGNVTGTSNQVPIAATLDLIKQLTPKTNTIGILYASNEDNSLSQVEAFTAAAEKDGYEVVAKAVPSSNEITSSMNVLADQVDALFVPQDNTIASAFTNVVAIAKEKKLPIFPSVDSMLAQGGLAAVYQSQYEIGVETAKVAVQLLEGKEVSQVPVKVIDTGTPAVNLPVAKELGIEIPADVLEAAKADGIVIEK